jgi:hypothetical protein
MWYLCHRKHAVPSFGETSRLAALDRKIEVLRPSIMKTIEEHLQRMLRRRKKVVGSLVQVKSERAIEDTAAQVPKYPPANKEGAAAGWQTVVNKRAHGKEKTDKSWRGERLQPRLH